MKKIWLTLFSMMLLIINNGCTKKEEVKVLSTVDTITKASGSYNYERSTYNLKTLKEKLTPNEFKNITPTATLSTVNDDNTPNVGIFIPSLVTVNNKDYMVAWFSSDTHTLHNLKSGRYGVYMFVEYNNKISSQTNDSSEEKTKARLERNKGCRVVVKYVGDDRQEELYRHMKYPTTLKNNKLFLDIVKIYPLG